MHYHLEIVMPPAKDVEKAVASIMKPFDENYEENCHTFWDWYEIGGRYSGAKLQATVPPDTMKAFKHWLQESKFTVSGITYGKQALQPASQCAVIDAKWQEMTGLTGPCPIFQHSNATTTILPDDVCLLRDAPPLTAFRVIIAGPSYNWGIYAGPPEAVYMIEEEYWNGVTHVKAIWDGTLTSALKMFSENCRGYRDEWMNAHTPTDEWLVVTVDYHNSPPWAH
jgi:hypothetical protein